MTPIILCMLSLLALAVPSDAQQFFFGARTCLARCGKASTIAEKRRGLCSCDHSCVSEGNCCGDYLRFCSTSCRDRCGNAYHPLQSCQCHNECDGDNCCDDYIRLCVAGAEPTDPPTPAAAAVPRTLPIITPSTTPLPNEKGYSYLTGREVVCPDGIAFVACPTNPCEQPCERHPDATCLVNQCGTCEARYFDFVGNELDCYDPEKYCPDGTRIFDCGDEDLCRGTSCAGFPRAACVPNRCGGCYYDYVDEKGNIVNCELDLQPSTCGAGVEILECNPMPCTGQICAADITARCRDVTCGECRADFYDVRGNIVNCNATEPAACPDECKRDPCLGAVCGPHPKAECRSKKTTRCGECEPSFSLGGKLLRDIDCVVPNKCRKNRKKCGGSPCRKYTCPGKDIICIAQYCNGCNALFFSKEGRKLRQEDCYDISALDLPTCADGKTAQLCSSDLCLGQRCGRDHSPNCKPDECNNCALIFFDDEGSEINCEDDGIEPGVEVCADGNEPLKCEASACDKESCPGDPEAKCFADPCDYCKIRFFDEKLNEVECVEPETTTEPEITTLQPPPNRCPSGKPFLDCSPDLCKSAVCATNRNAMCRTNPCDNCKVMFFDEIGRRVNCDPNYIGTCVGRCGEVRKVTNGCHCDYDCAERGDCCSNFAQICESCTNRCGKYTSYATCQCTSDCRQKQTCCEDFMDICLAKKTCKGECDSLYDKREICQCHPRCVRRRNCCPDYVQECA